MKVMKIIEDVGTEPKVEETTDIGMTENEETTTEKDKKEEDK